MRDVKSLLFSVNKFSSGCHAIFGICRNFHCQGPHWFIFTVKELYISIATLLHGKYHFPRLSSRTSWRGQRRSSCWSACRTRPPRGTSRSPRTSGPATCCGRGRAGAARAGQATSRRRGRGTPSLSWPAQATVPPTGTTDHYAFPVSLSQYAKC